MHTRPCLPFAPLPKPEGSFCYQTPGSRPSRPFGWLAFMMSQPSQPFLTSLAVDWHGSNPSSLFPIEIMTKSRVSEGTRTADLPYLEHMRDDDEEEEIPNSHREKETPASLSPPPGPAHTYSSSR